MASEAPHSPASRAILIAEEAKNIALSELSKTATIRIGVSGNGGSFSEKAAIQYALERYKREGGTNPLRVLIVYLLDAEGALKALEAGEVDRAIFPTMNNHGLIVKQNLPAQGRYRWTPELDSEDEPITIPLPVRHVMMRRQGALGKPRFIVTQRTALKQCENNVDRRYPDAEFISYNDTATAAADLADGSLVEKLAALNPIYREIPLQSIGVIGPQDCVELHSALKVGYDGSFLRLFNKGRGIQDHSNNVTEFVVAQQLPKESHEQ
jgi:prephenate dehydratase